MDQNFRFGFELEGFYYVSGKGATIPPKSWPTDTMPGLVELRTKGGKPLREAYFSLMQEYHKYFKDLYLKSAHNFTDSEVTELRKRYIDKGGVSISNIYGKTPKRWGKTTPASLQINISYLKRGEYIDKNGVRHPAEYQLFDFVPVIRKLDEAFAGLIKASKRVPGEYSIKDNGTRVEYRSLPCTAFAWIETDLDTLFNKIEGCFE